MSLASLFIATSRRRRPGLQCRSTPRGISSIAGSRACRRRHRDACRPARQARRRAGQRTAAIWSRASSSTNLACMRRSRMVHGAQPRFESRRRHRLYRRGVRLNQIAPSTNIGKCWCAGDRPRCSITDRIFDCGRVDLSPLPGLRHCFGPEVEARRYFAKTGIYPINHTVVVSP